MACVTGTNIVNDGLVFHFDLENGVKSWKGKPTSNLAVGKFFDGNVNFTTDETIQDELPDGSIGDVRYLNADYVYDPNRTVSIGNYSLTAGETYTLSFYVKNIDCTGFGGNLYSPGLGRVIGSIVYPTIYTDRWTRVVKTFTIPDEGVNPVSMSPQAFRDGGNGFFKMCWLQLEQGSVATKYINGIRLDTASIIDISPTRSTITAANLTYRQDDTPTFDGTNDYMAIDPLAIPSNSSISLEVWSKVGSVTSSSVLEAKNSAGGRTLNVHLPWGNWIVYFDCGGPNGSTSYDRLTYDINYMTSIEKTSWHHWCFIKDISSQIMDIYLDGNKVATSGGRTLVPDVSVASRIGSYAYGGNHYNGEISQVKIYNKALTDAEVKQNFEATRTRYGI